MHLYIKLHKNSCSIIFYLSIYTVDFIFNIIYRLQLNLALCNDKVDACLEAVENIQLKCMETPCMLDSVSLQRLRSTLAAVHVPTSTLRNDLLLFTGKSSLCLNIKP